MPHVCRFDHRPDNSRGERNGSPPHFPTFSGSSQAPRFCINVSILIFGYLSLIESLFEQSFLLFVPFELKMQGSNSNKKECVLHVGFEHLGTKHPIRWSVPQAGRSPIFQSIWHRHRGIRTRETYFVPSAHNGIERPAASSTKGREGQSAGWNRRPLRARQIRWSGNQIQKGTRDAHTITV